MSLRSRLVVGVALVAAVLFVAAAIAARLVEGYLVGQVDTSLRENRLARGFDPGGRGPGPDLGDPPSGFSSLFVGVVEADGSLSPLLTPNLTDATPPLPSITPARAVESARTGAAFTAGSEDPGVRYRVLARGEGPLGQVLVVARPLTDVDSAVTRLRAVQALSTALALIVLALVTWWVVRLGVRPIKRMTTTAAAIADGDLSQRVPTGTPGTEAGELGDALNHMLGRIEEAFAQRARSEHRLRQFVADASHELRTPVTTIRGYAELYRAGGLADAAELAEAMRRTGEEAVRMGSLVDDLLVLARLDQGVPPRAETVDLAAVARDAVRDARAVQPDRPVTATVDAPLTVRGDRDRLRQVAANLLGNALVHTPLDTPVDVRVRRDGHGAVLEVSDRGPGMSPEAAARAFERFYRADPSRSRHRGGSGLGLAIVEATVRAHGGSVTLDSEPGKGTTVRVLLPATDSA
jgi:two-component system, OmpR family, sensor kinase